MQPEYERIVFEMLDGTVPADLLAELKAADELCLKATDHYGVGSRGVVSRQAIAAIVVNWKIRNGLEL